MDICLLYFIVLVVQNCRGRVDDAQVKQMMMFHLGIVNATSTIIGTLRLLCLHTSIN